MSTTFGPIQTDNRQTESDAYELIVQVAQVGSITAKVYLSLGALTFVNDWGQVEIAKNSEKFQGAPLIDGTSILWTLWTVAQSSRNMPVCHVRQTSADVQKRAPILPDILSGKVQCMENVRQERKGLPVIN